MPSRILAIQPSLTDHQNRLDLLEQLGDPRPKLERTVDWKAFRSLLGSTEDIQSTLQYEPLVHKILAFLRKKMRR